jgi:uncharacterized coiled-coil protein SlyX
MEQRIVSLEEKVTFLERHVEELDGQVRELFDLLASIRGEIGRLRSQTEIRFTQLAEGSEEEDDPNGAGPGNPV